MGLKPQVNTYGLTGGPPVFGQAKENRGIRRFMRRGLAAADSEWALICATGNILKLFGHAGGRSLDEILAPAR